MKCEIGDMVVCKKTGREGEVFDYGWVNPSENNSAFNALLVKLGDLQLEIWRCDNVKIASTKKLATL